MYKIPEKRIPENIYQLMNNDELGKLDETSLVSKLLRAYHQVSKEYINGEKTFLSDKKKFYSNYQCRYAENKSVIQPEYELYDYNLVRIPNIPQRCFILAEGPRENNLKDLFYATITHPQSPVNVFIAVGAIAENGKEKFFPYFNEDNAISRDEFFAKVADRNIIAQNTSFNFYQINDKGKDAFVVHMPQWPDHSVKKLAQGDIETLAFIAEYVPNLLCHCSAGIGRGATVLAAIMGFYLNFFKETDDDKLIENMVRLIGLMKEVRPYALYTPNNALMAVDVMEDMHRFKQLNPTLFGTIKIISGSLHEHFRTLDGYKSEEEELDERTALLAKENKKEDKEKEKSNCCKGCVIL